MVTIPRLAIPEPQVGSSTTSKLAKSALSISMFAERQELDALKIDAFLQKQEQDSANLQKSKLDSDFRVELTTKAEQLKQDPAIQKDPSLFSEELNQFGEDYINESTKDLSFYEKSYVGEALQSTLKKQVLSQGSSYQIKQNAVNQLNDLGSLIDNASLEAFHNPENANASKVSLVNQIKDLESGQVLTLDQGQAIVKKGLAQIDRGVLQGYLNKGDLEGADKYLDNEEVQRNIGIDLVTSYKGHVNNLKIKRDEELDKIREKKLTLFNIENDLISGKTIDPTDEDTQQSLDLYYDESIYVDNQGSQRRLSEGVEELDPKAGASLSMEIARTAYIPKGAVNTLNSFVLHGTAQQREYALDLISRIDENDKYGMATKFLDKKTYTVATIVNRDTNAGMPLTKSLKIAEEITTLDKDTEDIRRSELSSIHFDKKQDFTKFMKQSIETATGIDDGHWYTWGSSSFDERTEPVLANKALADYRVLYDDYYMSTGDQELATKLANKDFSRLYTITDFSGKKRLMKYAPELYYSVPELNRDQNSEWQKMQLQDEVSSVVGREIKSEDIILVPDDRTAREAGTAGGQPTYLMLINQDGDYVEVRKKGVPQRFYFDPATVRKEYMDKLKTERYIYQEEKRQKAVRGERQEILDKKEAEREEMLKEREIKSKARNKELKEEIKERDKEDEAEKLKATQKQATDKIIKQREQIREEVLKKKQREAKKKAEENKAKQFRDLGDDFKRYFSGTRREANEFLKKQGEERDKQERNKKLQAKKNKALAKGRAIKLKRITEREIRSFKASERRAKLLARIKEKKKYEAMEKKKKILFEQRKRNILLKQREKGLIKKKRNSKK